MVSEYTKQAARKQNRRTVERFTPAGIAAAEKRFQEWKQANLAETKKR